MNITSPRQVENWLRSRGGLGKGLPRLREKIKSGLLTTAEVAVVKEYLANLDASAFVEAPVGAEAPKKGAKTAVVVAVMVAALAAALVAIR